MEIVVGIYLVIFALIFVWFFASFLSDMLFDRELGFKYAAGAAFAMLCLAVVAIMLSGAYELLTYKE